MIKSNSTYSSEARDMICERASDVWGADQDVMSIVLILIQSKFEFSYSAFSNKHINAIGNSYTIVTDMQVYIICTNPVLSISNYN